MPDSFAIGSGQRKPKTKDQRSRSINTIVAGGRRDRRLFTVVQGGRLGRNSTVIAPLVRHVRPRGGGSGRYCGLRPCRARPFSSVGAGAENSAASLEWGSEGYPEFSRLSDQDRYQNNLPTVASGRSVRRWNREGVTRKWKTGNKERSSWMYSFLYVFHFQACI